MVRIAHIYAHGCKNAGDIYLIWATKKVFEPANWIDINAKKIFCKQDINQLNECDIILIGGGGLILPDSFNFESPFGWQVGIPTNLISEIEKPIIFYAVGWNLFKGQQPSKQLVASLLAMAKQSSFFSLRHQGDIKKFEAATGLMNKVNLNFCPSIVAEPYLPTTSNRIAFQIAGDRWNYRFTSDNDFIDKITKLCCLFSNKCFVAHTVSDVGISKKLAEYFTCDFINLTGQSPAMVKNFYRTIGTVFAMRGHAQMIPLGLGCKIVSLISHDKIKFLLEDLDLLPTGVDVEDDNFINSTLQAYECAQTIDFKSRVETVLKNISANKKIIDHLIAST